MNLNRRQITVIVAALLSFQEEFTKEGEFHQEIDELINRLNEEHMKIIKEE